MPDKRFLTNANMAGVHDMAPSTHSDRSRSPWDGAGKKEVHGLKLVGRGLLE